MVKHCPDCTRPMHRNAAGWWCSCGKRIMDLPKGLQGKEGEEVSEYLTATQAAKRLGTSLTNVARWCRDGTLPAERLGIGRIWQIKAEDVEHFTPPARGPKPGGERKRLLDLAKEMVQSYGVDCISEGLETPTSLLAHEGHCSRARARQALAKAIRMARGANHDQ